MDEYTKVYEEKTAKDNQGDGSPGSGPAWMRWTRLYLIGNAPDAEHLLGMAETAQGPISNQHVADLTGLPQMNVDPVVLSGHIWKYLNQATVKSARSIFENLEIRNGLEAWRRLYRHIHKGSLLQKHTLGQRIQSPAAYLKEAGNLSIGIDKWEQDIRDYMAAGGQAPAEDAMVMNLCSALPGTLRSNLIWRTNEFQSYMQFKHYVVEQVERLEHFNGKGAVMYMGEEDEDHLYAMVQERLKDYPDIAEALALSRQRGSGGRFTRQPGARTTPGGGAGGGARQLPGARRDDATKMQTRCINCGGNHRSSECTKPKLDKSQRPCWTCGKAGCIAATCKAKKSLNNLGNDERPNEEEGDEEVLMVGWHTIQPRRKNLTQCTLGDYIGEALKKDKSPRRSGKGSLPPTDESAKTKPLLKGPAPIKTCNRFERLHQWERPSDETTDDKIETNIVDSKVQEPPQEVKEKNMNEPHHVEKMHDSYDNSDIVKAFTQDFSKLDMHSREIQRDINYNDDGANIFEYEDDLLLPVEDDEVILEITADTGAVDNVMNPREIPGFPIKESYGSKHGKHFMGAGAERIRNEGEIRLSMEPTDGGKKLGSTFQAADITRTLLSISKVCDAAPDTSVTFTSKEGIVRRQGRDVAKFYRKGGLYVMRVKVKKPKPDPNDGGGNASSFPRQGAKR